MQVNTCYNHREKEEKRVARALTPRTPISRSEREWWSPSRWILVRVLGASYGLAGPLQPDEHHHVASRHLPLRRQGHINVRLGELL
jgi:hypothetical protein